MGRTNMIVVVDVGSNRSVGWLKGGDILVC